MGFNREPGGTLNSMTTGGKASFYLTDAIGSVIGLADEDGNKVDSYTYSPRGVRILAQAAEPVAQPCRFAGNYQGPSEDDAEMATLWIVAGIVGAVLGGVGVLLLQRKKR